MKIRKLDGNHDWKFGKGLSDYATEELAVDENVQTRLLSWIGDCFFALQEGVDWKGRLETGQQEFLLEELKSVVLQSYGVTGINNLQVVFDSKTRNVQIQYDIQTIYSQSFQNVLNQTAGVVN